MPGPETPDAGKRQLALAGAVLGLLAVGAWAGYRLLCGGAGWLESAGRSCRLESGPGHR